MQIQDDVFIVFIVLMAFFLMIFNDIFSKRGLRGFFELTRFSYVGMTVFIVFNYLANNEIWDAGIIKSYVLIIFSSMEVAVYFGYYLGATIEWKETLGATSFMTHYFMPVYSLIKLLNDPFEPQGWEFSLFAISAFIHFLQQWGWRLWKKENLYPGLDIATLKGNLLFFSGIAVAMLVTLTKFLLQYYDVIIPQWVGYIIMAASALLFVTDVILDKIRLDKKDYKELNTEDKLEA